MDNQSNEICIKSIRELFNLELNIPNYQRPYKWTTKNIGDFIEDIDSILSLSELKENFKYRIGTIILHAQDGKYDIIDGQQRVITCMLLFACLGKTEELSFYNKYKAVDIESKTNINRNWKIIKEWLLSKPKEQKDKLNNFLSSVFEVVVVVVNEKEKAFQLFDSQNTRGKALDPHDLLKAYHLRAMREYPYEMRHAVTKWENVKSDEIKELFNLYLYPSINWIRRKKVSTFTTNEIDLFKGVSENSPYTYAKRAKNAMPYFQIAEPIIEGQDFFDMVHHYLELLGDLKSEIENNSKFKYISQLLNLNKLKDDEVENENLKGKQRAVKSTGFMYLKNLFYCVLLCYYDKFHNFDELAVKKLFIWVFSLRLAMKNIGYDTINNYVISYDDEKKYSNQIAMFEEISKARKHTEIYKLSINYKIKNCKAKDSKWEFLFEYLEEINNSNGGENNA